MPPAAYRPFELKPKPTTGLPPRIMFVITATADVVILLKSMYALRPGDRIGVVISRTPTIRTESPTYPVCGFTASLSVSESSLASVTV
jgi:hypothetical protein